MIAPFGAGVALNPGEICSQARAVGLIIGAASCCDLDMRHDGSRVCLLISVALTWRNGMKTGSQVAELVGAIKKFAGPASEFHFAKKEYDIQKAPLGGDQWLQRH